jgi:hypothetical protein
LVQLGTGALGLGRDQLSCCGDARLGYVFGQLRVAVEQTCDRFDFRVLAKLALELRDADEILLDTVETLRPTPTRRSLASRARSTATSMLGTKLLLWLGVVAMILGSLNCECLYLACACKLARRLQICTRFLLQS